MKIAEFSPRNHKKSRAAGCIFFCPSTKKFCLAKRSNREMSYPGYWSTWGGKTDPGETPEETVLREIKEEAGYDSEIDLVPMLTNIDEDRGSVYFNFLAIVPEQFEPELNWENSDYIWVSFGKWPEKLHPGVVELFNDDDSVEIMQQYADR